MNRPSKSNKKLVARKSEKHESGRNTKDTKKRKTLVALRIPVPPGVTSLTAPKSHKTASMTVAAGAQTGVQTIIYIHGIGNKPEQSTLQCQWDTALFGTQLGDRSRMAYWVNREYYPDIPRETCASGDVVRIDNVDVSTRVLMARSPLLTPNMDELIDDEIDALTDDDARRDWLRKLSAKVSSRVDDSAAEKAALAAGDVRAKLLPKPFRRFVTQQLTRAFLRDVNDFLFIPERQAAMQQSLVDRLNAGGGPFIVIAHSQGSMIAYNVLRQLSKQDCDVRLFLTIGSPLGLSEIQDVLREWAGGVLRVPQCVDRWVNIADILDPVAVDRDLKDDYEPGTVDDESRLFLNTDSPFHPHSATGYLASKEVRTVVRETAGNAFGQAVGKTIIVRDLARDLENGSREARHPALIQLRVPSRPESDDMTSLDKVRESLSEYILELAAESGLGEDAINLEKMKRYVSARLTRLEIERLRTRFRDLQIERIWRDANKKALISSSTNTVQARPANIGYEAIGREIGWAVLDTGIRADHPHFKRYGNVVSQWDCTKRGKPLKVSPTESNRLDKNGHGTHVAGIIAGSYEFPGGEGPGGSSFAGMAPAARLYGFKVLDDQGNGQDSYIIKALDLIADLNEQAGRMLIHGINLSLGGSFDPGVYGCGHTPLCVELRRLWGQGILVCLAAGNEGYAVLQSLEGDVATNVDLSIGDPANLDEAIAVGSVHKTNPHTFGVSYFSSRGPTADGRAKPDLVAPGEQILSAYHDHDPKITARKAKVSDLYIEMSGTSMACPHVSGLLAAFLSARPEFIGYPDQVKKRLLDNCTDLGRDVYAQGRGMPNLIKMLANS